ncbi:helix-turn-helix domain-containing protein [Niastella sp. OAS944]|uniref:helix-turn-helix domain-containing protein n=1 Tax=Niastella sp. OAS944 TaxID=2664089 RepID=UPI00348BD20A|nr:transposase-like protein [Chitinophagaceae bacterium OAS944]
MVEKDHEQTFKGRYSAKGNWDKRFIAEVVEEIHNGMSYQAANQKYNVSIKTLHRWIFDSKMAVPSGKLKRPVPIEIKRSVVRAIQSGRLTVKEAQRTYGIKTVKTINSWIHQFNLENAELAVVNESGMKKKKPVEGNSTDNNQDIKGLQKALEEAQLKVAALNTLIDVAEEQLKINIRKKPGAKQSND